MKAKMQRRGRLLDRAFPGLGM